LGGGADVADGGLEVDEGLLPVAGARGDSARVERHWDINASAHGVSFRFLGDSEGLVRRFWDCGVCHSVLCRLLSKDRREIAFGAKGGGFSEHLKKGLRGAAPLLWTAPRPFVSRRRA